MNFLSHRHTPTHKHARASAEGESKKKKKEEERERFSLVCQRKNVKLVTHLFQLINIERGRERIAKMLPLSKTLVCFNLLVFSGDVTFNFQ